MGFISYNRNMNKKINPIFFVLFVVAACAPASPPELADPQMANTPIPEVPTPAGPSSTAESASTEIPQQPFGWEIDVVAEGLEIPWSVVFPSEERILVSERPGAIREIVDRQLNPDPIYQFDEVAHQGEAGLMGLALHPDYAHNRYVYACYATSTEGRLIDRVVRLVDQDGAMELDALIVDNIPAAQNHAGCRIKFGPDGKLYITTGDATQGALAQDTSSLAGKILRVNPDGSIPDDNPFEGLPVYSYGHRNPQGIDWQPETGMLYTTEHGPSGFDGPPGGDEVNIILPGGNYGWPLVSHDEIMAGTISPIIQFTPAEAPASALYYASDTLPFFTDSLFFGALRGEGVVRLTLSKDGNQVERIEKIVADVGRVRDVVSGPDGLIYFTTSNRDGRGQVQEGDDKLFRIVPLFE